MIDRFKKSDKIGCFIGIHPPITFISRNLMMSREVGLALRSSDTPTPGSMPDFHFPEQDLGFHQGWPQRIQLGIIRQCPDRLVLEQCHNECDTSFSA
jgi:hypothetical protein